MLISHVFLLQPQAVFFTCMDSRMIPTRFTETNVGDMFVGMSNTHLDFIMLASCFNLIFWRSEYIRDRILTANSLAS